MHNQKCLLTESENVGIEDEEAEAEDDSDAKEESHRCVKLTPKVSVQPAEGFYTVEKSLEDFKGGACQQGMRIQKMGTAGLR